VPGIDFSNDPLLAGRIHSYVDTQISRLVVPTSRVADQRRWPRCTTTNDGMHRQAI
jgi:catalase